MDVFSVRDQLVADYREFTGSFVTIHDDRIRDHVAQRNASDYQSPDPWLSLNPNFAAGGTVTELVAQGALDAECERIFRIKPEPADAGGPVLRLHRHQQDALQVARGGHSYVLTTGTGSGKSLTYLIPIVDRVLRARHNHTWRPGVKAIVVYPMNALANSQVRELTKFLHHGYPGGKGPVTFERYTGQEDESERARILKDPPDILLTNYVMLELVLTRPRERERLVEAARGLWFLVLDELHTYRGRQGADVALLARRVREACQAPDVQCVGTSATMTSEGSHATQRRVVAQVATRLFGVPVAPEHVIDETLERVTTQTGGGRAALAGRVRALAAGQWPHPTYPEFVADPLAAWVETTLGLEQEDLEPDGDSALWTRRRSPLTLSEAAAALALPQAASPTRPAGRRSRPCSRPVPTCATRRPGGRCSRSGCTSSFPRATTSMLGPIVAVGEDLHCVKIYQVGTKQGPQVLRRHAHSSASNKPVVIDMLPGGVDPGSDPRPGSAARSTIRERTLKSTACILTPSGRHRCT